MTDQAHGLPDVTSLLLSTDSLEQFLQMLAERALSMAPTAAGTGITVERQHRPLTVASAGGIAPDLDEAQYGQDDGPCLEALRTGREVIVSDMLDETRWGPYPAYAVARGTRSSASLPIAPHTDTAGALNLYSSTVDGFLEAGLDNLRALAAQATGAIALAQRLSDAQEYATDLQTAMESRSVIDQAIGVIMGQQRCDADEAFRLLRMASQRRNIKLRDLCREMLTTIGGGPPAQGAAFRPRP
ncbi:GAF and ANTAR domain-containing protein [Streptomyces fumanus]|uniref:Transcription antitermination regulator n=1 Tax=Streptomyces fumanus TaxID=67302 RepID=A0A919AEY3_9ACTN|nr:GAF and ANTAR domain-containing protein [Streptomyces fumanus]GHF01805.1 transcription antitermination regulator [Streptomyces fumanus]